ncbi:MAG: S8 family peptidase [Lachnospiraceae bacterium]|nr:S8 family peptidase [Lachnospiraceae bacterium]
MNKDKYPIIAHGELYVESISKKVNFPPREWPHQFEEAKENICQDLNKIRKKIQDGEEVFLEEKVLCIRLEPKLEAKSYVPDSLIVSEDMKIIGGRKYSFVDKDGEEKKAKLYFIKTRDEGIEKLEHTLRTGIKDGVDKFRRQVQCVKNINLLSYEEKVQGIEDDWKNGPVEIVLHPLESSTQTMISTFLQVSGLSLEQIKIKTYEKGLTFISATCDRDKLAVIEKFNPMRSLHPMGKIDIEPMRAIQEVEGPKAAPKKMRSNITIGMFDGGIVEEHSLLNGYVRANDVSIVKATNNSLAHGNSVCGAILYGHLGGKTLSDVLDNPPVFVESFRVLPTETQLTNERNAESIHGMYETIDQIEKIVMNRKDIRLYNLSFGPKEPILDDNISRFTYALDRLTYSGEEGEVNPLFCVAVGNDGDKGEYLDRIQAPSDMINGLSVGAYTYNIIGKKTRADYSSIGPGREGAKTKPDLLEFGGSQERPFVIVGSKGNKIGISAGTSLATPVTTGKIGQLMAHSMSITPHMGRTLLIHNAKLSSGIRSDEEGFGYSEEETDHILECVDNRVTILYSGELPAASTLKVPIFSPGIDQANGKVSVTWTITTIVNPDITDTDAYTNNCIEDTFYPNSMVFNFTKTGKKAVKINLTKPEEAKQVKELLEFGYKMSELPVSGAAKKDKSENALRNKDLKWDTVIKKTKTMYAKSLLSPFLTLHALGRNGYEHESIKYFVAVTIDAKGYNGNMYDNILQTYNNLLPIDIQNINHVMVPIE